MEIYQKISKTYLGNIEAATGASVGEIEAETTKAFVLDACLDVEKRRMTEAGRSCVEKRLIKTKFKINKIYKNLKKNYNYKIIIFISIYKYLI